MGVILQWESLFTAVGIYCTIWCGCNALDMPKSREMTKQIDWRAKQPSQVVCISEDLEVLKSFQHYLWVQSQGNHTINHLDEKGVERGSTWQSRSVGELQTLPVGTKPRKPHYQSPGWERCGKRKHLTIFVERTRDGHHQSNKHLNCFKGNIGETSERCGGVLMGHSKRIDTTIKSIQIIFFKLWFVMEQSTPWRQKLTILKESFDNDCWYAWQTIHWGYYVQGKAFLWRLHQGYELLHWLDWRVCLLMRTLSQALI